MRRVEVLDVWRSLCIIGMIAYHALYDLVHFGAVDSAVMRTLPAHALHYSVVWGFILVSGIAARFSRNGFRRGLIVLCAALVVSLGSSLVDLPIRFGILHFLGVAMILCAGLRDRLFPEGKGLRLWQPVLFLTLFALTSLWIKNTMVSAHWLYPFGFQYAGFYSSDYYPLLPWLFLYATGAWLGGLVLANRDKELLTRRFPPALTFAGRHSLLIYMLHQPVLYGLCVLLF